MEHKLKKYLSIASLFVFLLFALASDLEPELIGTDYETMCGNKGNVEVDLLTEPKEITPNVQLKVIDKVTGEPLSSIFVQLTFEGLSCQRPKDIDSCPDECHMVYALGKGKLEGYTNAAGIAQFIPPSWTAYDSKDRLAMNVTVEPNLNTVSLVPYYNTFKIGYSNESPTYIIKLLNPNSL